MTNTKKNPSSTQKPVNKNTLWQTVLLVSVLATSAVYAIPNLYGNDPSIIIANKLKSESESPEVTQQHILELLNEYKLPVKSTKIENDRIIVQFDNLDTQFKAYDTVFKSLAKTHHINYFLAPQSPEWLKAVGATPLQLGLDLQGGVHLQYEVDLDKAFEKSIQRYRDDIRLTLQGANIRYQEIAASESIHKGISINFNSSDELVHADSKLKNIFPELDVKKINTEQDHYQLQVNFPKQLQAEIKQLAMDKNISVFRSRVDQLGIAEPIIQKQGENRIIVELPGAQNPDEIIATLGSTASLEFRLAHE